MDKDFLKKYNTELVVNNQLFQQQLIARVTVKMVKKGVSFYYLNMNEYKL